MTLKRLWQEGRRSPRLAAYVDITREDFESWLNSLGMRWKAKAGTAGIYLIPLSKYVAIKVSSSIGGTSITKGYAKASMQMRMVSQLTGQVLNKKLQGSSHFKRTTNWKKTLTAAVNRFKEAYTKAKSFYDALAGVEDRDSYKSDMLSMIESIPGWESQKTLQGYHATVTQGRFLTVRERATLERAYDKKGIQFPAAPAPTVLAEPAPPEELPTPSIVKPEVNPAVLQRLRRLWMAAKRADDVWTMDFVRSVGEQYKSKGALSDGQKKVLQRKSDRYGV